LLKQSVITSTRATYCIPAKQLINKAPCDGGRRRREIALIIDMVEEAKRQHQEKEGFSNVDISPNPTEK